LGSDQPVIWPRVEHFRNFVEPDLPRTALAVDSKDEGGVIPFIRDPVYTGVSRSLLQRVRILQVSLNIT
jgi:hypothetical protein